MTILSIIDIETTGIDPNEHAIVEIAAIDLIDGAICLPRSSLIRPPHSIPAASSAIHHLVDADVAAAPMARDIVPEILGDQTGRVYVAHNAKFESAFLAPFLPGATWACSYKAALRIWPQAEGYSNQFLRYWLGLAFGGEAMPPHRALPDCHVTARIFAELLKYASVEDMIGWFGEPPLLPHVTFGKHRGKKWDELPVDYLQWVRDQKDMDPDLVWNAKHELDHRSAEANAAISERLRIEKETRDAYVGLAVKIAKEARTVDDLRKWLNSDEEKANRERYRVSLGTPEYAKIVAACSERKAELLATQPLEKAA